MVKMEERQMPEQRESARPTVNITGASVALGPLARKHTAVIHRWFNDFWLARTDGDNPGPRTREHADAWYERRMTATDQAWFAVYEIATWRLIGMVALAEIDYRHRTAIFSISIGEESARGKGYGTEVTRLMLDYAFTALGLHNVSLGVYSHNLAGIRAYQKAGFREYGRRHECFLMGGRYWDEILMECLSTDFASETLSAVFVPDTPR
jgi:diamine N-acetyltransferase